MGAALVLLLVGVGALAAGVLVGRYYVPDDRQLRRTARHSRAYLRALTSLIARDPETVVAELRGVVEESVDDVEPYFALAAMFRSTGEHERAIRVHQALALRERDKKKLRLRALYELGLDFRAAGMPRRATRALEEVLADEPAHEGALRGLAGLYEEQARYQESAALWQRLGKRRGEDLSEREHHLLVAAGQTAIARGDLDSAKQLLKAAQKLGETAHGFVGEAELAAARGDQKGAREKLVQALTADPALAPHVVPALVAAEGEQAAAATLAEIEAKTGPRLELSLVRSQLGGVVDLAGFPDAIAARVAAARSALADGDAAVIRAALDRLAGDEGALAWALRGRWQCGACGARPAQFQWRCAACRKWGSLRMETGIEPAPIAAPSRDRRMLPREKPQALLGEALPEPSLDPGLSDDELARVGARRSLLGRVGGWFGRR